MELSGTQKAALLRDGYVMLPGAVSSQLVIAGNNSPNIRYAVYFRLKHVDHDTIHWECMTDIWREWSGMRHVVGAAA